MLKILSLEAKNKCSVSYERTEEIKHVLQQIKMIDAFDIVQSMMYAKQNTETRRERN